MSLRVKPHHPLQELLAKLLFGIETVSVAEQKRMVNRACREAAKWYDARTTPIGSIRSCDLHDETDKFCDLGTNDGCCGRPTFSMVLDILCDLPSGLTYDQSCEHLNNLIEKLEKFNKISIKNVSNDS